MTTRVHSASPYERRYGFCRALRRGARIEVAGTAPIGEDGHTVPGDAAAQAARCFTLAMRCVEELGGTVDDVVRTRMYITDAADAERIGAVHGRFFGEAPPVATMVVVAGLLDPDWRVEIELEAHVLTDGLD